jgi:uncharacterized membrane protein SirB2
MNAILPLVRWHVLLAWCSIGLFLLRGGMVQFGTPSLQAFALNARVQMLVFAVNAFLLITGLSLWGSLAYNPMRDTWLAIKLMALIGYVVCGHWAMRRAPMHVLGYLTAIALLALAMDLSINRQFLPG